MLRRSSSFPVLLLRPFCPPRELLGCASSAPFLKMLSHMAGQTEFDLDQFDIVVIFWSCKGQQVLDGCVSPLMSKGGHHISLPEYLHCAYIHSCIRIASNAQANRCS